MKSLGYVIIAVALLGLLVYTNPTMDGYQAFIHGKIVELSREKGDDAAAGLAMLFGGLASSLVISQTTRRDFLVASFYDTDLGGEHIRSIGFLRNFVVVETPDSLK